MKTTGGYGLWGPMKLDRLYTITVEPMGNLTMTSEPIKGIYREALRQRMESNTAVAATTRPAQS